MLWCYVVRNIILSYVNIIGSVLLEDISEMYLDDSTSLNQLVFIFVESSRALKSSRGRTSVAVRFQSAGECEKFASSMAIMRNYFE